MPHFVVGDENRRSSHLDQVYVIAAPDSNERQVAMELPPVSHLIAFYPVRDLAATRDFYARDLGLALARDQGSCLIFGARGGGHFGFCLHDGGDPLPVHDGLILTLVTPDVDAVYRHLRRVGVETESGPSRNEAFGIYHFFARDPDGYRVEVQRFDLPLPGC